MNARVMPTSVSGSPNPPGQDGQADKRPRYSLRMLVPTVVGVLIPIPASLPLAVTGKRLFDSSESS